MTGCEPCSCNRKIENKCTKINDKPKHTPPNIGSVLRCVIHSPLSQAADVLQFLVEHFIDPELIRGVESRMLEYTRIEPPIEITAVGDNVLCGTSQGILLAVVRVTQDVLKTVSLSIVLVPSFKRNLFPSSAEAKKGVEVVIERMAHLSGLESLVFS